MRRDKDRVLWDPLTLLPVNLFPEMLAHPGPAVSPGVNTNLVNNRPNNNPG